MASAAPALKDPPRANWEYKVLVIDRNEKPEVSEKRLGELGADGWEMASMCGHENGGTTLHFTTILKRAK